MLVSKMTTINTEIKIFLFIYPFFLQMKLIKGYLFVTLYFSRSHLLLIEK